MNLRSGEEEKTHFRTERYYCIGNEWFFMTREGQNMGPYSTKERAKEVLLLFIAHTENSFTSGEYNSKNSEQDLWSLTLSK